MLNESSRFSDLSSNLENETSRTLLLIDDDRVSRERLARALERKGFVVHATESVREGITIARNEQLDYAVIELRLGDGNGLDIVKDILQARPDTRIVMLTAYGNIATAVAAIKAGAIDYLPKPADPDAVENALLANGASLLPPAPEDPMSADRVRWEHIQRVFYQNECNVSETARRLRMHRRTLQRILSKHAPRDTRPPANDQGQQRAA